LDDTFAAFGAGAEVAYGALEVGASAEEAVKAAARRSITTGGLIQVEKAGLPDEED
jgi:hypothetical protein